jgi:hypothetical protein
MSIFPTAPETTATVHTRDKIDGRALTGFSASAPFAGPGGRKGAARCARPTPLGAGAFLQDRSGQKL